MGNNSIAYYNWFLIKRASLLLVLCFIAGKSNAQQENKLIREGNKLYNEKKYNEAISKYDAAAKIKPEKRDAQFNKADALYNTEKYEDAANLFQGLAEQYNEIDKKSAAYHNLGNSFLKQKKYEDAVKAYKNALKNKSNDEDTRYNLSYAQKMIQQQRQQQKDNKNDKNKDKQDKDKKDQNKEDKNKDKDKDKKDKDKDGGEDEKNKDQQNQEKGKEKKPNPNEMKKEDAQRILEALNRNEKDLQDKKKHEMKKGVRVQIEKDW